MSKDVKEMPVRLQEINLNLGSLDLGSGDAELDKRLAEYFVTTPQVLAVPRLRKSHFLGRKGAGKSALFIQLRELFTKAGRHKTRVISITPSKYAWKALRHFREEGLLSEQAYESAWELTLAVETAIVLAQEPECLFQSDSLIHLQRLKKFVEKNRGRQFADALDSAKDMLKCIDSFNLEAYGVKVGFKRRQSQFSATRQLVEDLFADIARLSLDVGAVIAVDRLDDSWDASDESKLLLIGLLKVVKDINAKYSIPETAKGVFCLVFLRKDIYQCLRFDDKDKHRALEENIVWTQDMLAQMVHQRLPKGVGLEDIFEPGGLRGSTVPFNYIVKRTFLRPREVIQFLQECIKKSGESAVEITKVAIRDAENTYSSWKVDDLKQEYHKVYPEFETLIEALRHGSHRYDSVNEFEARLYLQVPKTIEKLGMRCAIELLFDSSAIGVKLGKSNAASFKCENDDLMLPAEGAIYVHQSLHKGLNLVEKRVPSAAIKRGKAEKLDTAVVLRKEQRGKFMAVTDKNLRMLLKSQSEMLGKWIDISQPFEERLNAPLQIERVLVGISNSLSCVELAQLMESEDVIEEHIALQLLKFLTETVRVRDLNFPRLIKAVSGVLSKHKGHDLLRFAAARFLFVLSGARQDWSQDWKPVYGDSLWESIFDLLAQDILDPILARYLIYVASHCRDVTLEQDIIYEISFALDMGIRPENMAFKRIEAMTSREAEIVSKFLLSAVEEVRYAAALCLARLGCSSPKISEVLGSLLTSRAELSDFQFDEVCGHLCSLDDPAAIPHLVKVFSSRPRRHSAVIALSWLVYRNKWNISEQLSWRKNVLSEIEGKCSVLNTVKGSGLAVERFQKSPGKREYSEVGSQTSHCCDERGYLVYLVRGKDRGNLCWHYALVSLPLREQFVFQVRTEFIQIDNYGRILYSGWGKDPPEEIVRQIGIRWA